MRLARLVLIVPVLAVGLSLASCGNFDPTAIFDNEFFNNKKKLPGERVPVFPEGTPGVAQGVPPDLVKGYQAPPEPEPVREAQPAEKPKPRPKPKLVAKPKQESKPMAVTVQPAPSQPAWPEPPSQQAAQQPPAGGGGFGSPRPPGGVAWPDPPPAR